MNQQQLEQELKRREEEAARAATLIAAGFGEDVCKTVEGLLGSLAVASLIGTDANRIAALYCMGETLVNLAEREAQYLSDAEERQQALNAQMAAARGQRQPHVGRRRQLS